MLYVCVHRLSRWLYRLDEDAIEFLDKSICCFSELLRMVHRHIGTHTGTKQKSHAIVAKVSYL